MMETPNPFDHIGDAFKHAGDAIKHGAEDAGKTISDTGKDVVVHGDFDKAGRDIKHDSQKGADHAAHSADLIGNDLEAALMTTLNDIKHLGDQIKGEAKHDFDQLTGELRHTGDLCRNGLRDLGGQIRNELHKDGDALKKGLEEVGEETKKALQYDLEKIEEVLSSEILKEGLQKADKLIKELVKIVEGVRANAPELIDDLNSIDGTIEIGPILCNYSGIVDRLEDLAMTLDEYLDGKELELSRTLVKTLVADLGPDTIRLNLDEEMISRFGFLAKEVPLSIFTWAVDEILKELGVPE